MIMTSADFATPWGEQTHDALTLSAPAQSANFLGLFDRAGYLCSLTPATPEAPYGGPGALLRVERLPRRAGEIQATVFMRRATAKGEWLPRQRAHSLHAEIEANPRRDIVGRLAAATLRHIGWATGQPVTDGLRIEVTLHSPNGRTGLGMGSSASAAAVVMAVDALYGSPIRRRPDGQIQLMRLMARGEQIASGSIFYDNVAPLAVPGEWVFIPPAAVGMRQRVRVNSLPAGFHLVTITPDYPVSTAEARHALNDQRIDVRSAERAGARYAELVMANTADDIKGLLACVGNQLVEPFRERLNPALTHVRILVQSWNSRHPRSAPAFACGISGSGSTLYIVTGCAAHAQQAALEVPAALARAGYCAWAFIHTPNRHGAQVLDSE